MMKDIYKESVELTSAYLLEGCGKPPTAINDTIPHTRIDLGYAEHGYLYEGGCCSVPSCYMKTTAFSRKDLRKNTFTNM